VAQEIIVHPEGEAKDVATKPDLLGVTRTTVETFAGKIGIEWDKDALVSQLGQLPFFIDFLYQGGLFNEWVESCPLTYVSNNAPKKRDILGSLMLSVLSGHKRYSHITAIQSDGVHPELLGMKKVCSSDSVRRAFKKNIDENEAVEWCQDNLKNCYEDLLFEPWILDIDSSVKPLYGNQEGAEIGYNPTKPGRPCHTYHSYMMANLRLILEIEVQSGTQGSSKYSLPGLWALLDSIDHSQWPKFIRGDCAWGTDRVITECEDRGVDYLFKLKVTKRVSELIAKLGGRRDWEFCGKGVEGMESTIQLSGWNKSRKVVVIRRKVPKEVVVNERQPELALDLEDKVYGYEYSVLVTSLDGELLTLYHHYKDRADCENNFDELKNQWGWSGFVTQDLKRSRIMARCIALIYNWWSLFARLIDPSKHSEAITSRPLMLQAVSRATNHSRQRTVTITSSHGKAEFIQEAMEQVSAFFRKFTSTARQLNAKERWRLILSRALSKYLKGKILGPITPLRIG